MLRIALPLLPLALLAGCSEAAETVQLAHSGIADTKTAAQRICTTVGAVATGFGEEKATHFAERNLGLAVSAAKDRLVRQGAKGFSVEKPKVTCEGYIDFGAALGQEHKCHAVTRLCGQKV